MKERRQFPRLNDRLIVYIDSDTGLGVKETGESLDISAGGIRIAVPSKFNVGDIITLEINLLSDAIPVTAKGKVLWMRENPSVKQAGQKKYMIGIQFIDLEDVDKLNRQRIADYISITLKDDTENK